MQHLHVFLLVLAVGVLINTCKAQSPTYKPDPPAPATFVVLMNTTKGPIELAVTRYLARKRGARRGKNRRGADRFYTLVQSGYYNQNAAFRVIANFVAQWGISGDPAISGKWANNEIPNDPMVKSNLRGYVSFAAEMQGNITCCRTTQLYVNYVNNTYLDQYGFSPFAYVQSGMENFDQFYSGYAETPDQDQIYYQGNKYLQANFPLLDYIISAVVQQ